MLPEAKLEAIQGNKITMHEKLPRISSFKLATDVKKYSFI